MLVDVRATYLQPCCKTADSPMTSQSYLHFLEYTQVQLRDGRLVRRTYLRNR